MNQKILLRDKMILPILLAVYTLVMVAVSPITLSSGIAFLCLQILGILLPGRALLTLLGFHRAEEADCRGKRNLTVSGLEQTVWSYALGYALTIVEYFVLAPFSALWLLDPLQLLVTTGSLGYLFFFWYKNRHAPEAVDGQLVDYDSCGRDWVTIAVLLTIVLGIRFVTYYGFNLFPTAGQPVNFRTQDLLFYIGNAISAKWGFPVAEFRYAGETFYYHYLGSIQLAVESLLTGIDALHLEFCLAWLQPSLLVVTCFWCFLKRLGASFGKTVFGMFLLLFTTGKELIVYVAFQHKMYQSPFGWDIGMAFGIFFLTLLYLQWKQDTFRPGIWAASLLSLFVCEGSKAPIAVVLLFTAGCVCGLWLFTAKGRKRFWSLAYGIPLVVLFLLVFFGFVSNGMNVVTTNSSGLSLDITGHLYECGLGKLYFTWTAMGMPGVIGKLLILLLFFFGCNMAVYFLFTVCGLRLVRGGISRIFSFRGCLMAGTLFGLLMTLVTKQSGNSQMYFAMTSFPMAVAVSVAPWEEPRDRSGKPVARWLLYGVLSVLTVWSFLCFVQILNPSVEDGLRKLQGFSDMDQEESNSLTWEELTGYTWVRENTEKSAWFVTNIIVDDEQYQSFIAGACTERQMYLEGWRYVVGVMDEGQVMERRALVRDFFAGDEVAKKELLQDGVDYVLWTDRYGELTPDLEAFFGEKIYDNAAVCVYRLTAEGKELR